VGLRLLKPDYCKKFREKMSKYYPKDHKLYGYIDHINEHRFGGTKDSENGQLLCHVCHSKKTNMFSRSKIFYQKIKNKYSVISLKSSIKKINSK
jgi:5-methylcytosine-specific restriction endonuclease McrA